MDKNGDGLVTKQVRVGIKIKFQREIIFDIKIFLYEKTLWKMFLQEFMTICKNLTDDQVKAAFKQFDTSGDDKLDYREFCEMINKREREGNWSNC